MAHEGTREPEPSSGPRVWKSLSSEGGLHGCPHSPPAFPSSQIQPPPTTSKPLAGGRVNQTHSAWACHSQSAHFFHTQQSFPLPQLPAETGLREQLGSHWKKNKRCRKINTFFKRTVVLHSRPDSFSFLFSFSFFPDTTNLHLAREKRRSEEEETSRWFYHARTTQDGHHSRTCGPECSLPLRKLCLLSRLSQCCCAPPAVLAP